jgi:pimeloyl-ACP methyl ester carboxylesterase
MLVGTVRTLRDDGFPIGVPRCELVFKPTFEENDTAFKARVPGAQGEAHVILAGGHFLQEDCPAALADLLDDMVQRTR